MAKPDYQKAADAELVNFFGQFYGIPRRLLIRREREGDGESLDATPVAIPTGMAEPESLESMVRRFIRGEMSQAALAAGMETLDEAADVEPEEEPDILSGYEVQQLVEEEPQPTSSPAEPPVDSGEVAPAPAGEGTADAGS